MLDGGGDDAVAVAVNVIGLPVIPVAVAVIVLLPGFGPSVHETGCAPPPSFVVCTDCTIDPPPVTTVNVTVTPT
jgi:hypothetical protein